MTRILKIDKRLRPDSNPESGTPEARDNRQSPYHGATAWTITIHIAINSDQKVAPPNNAPNLAKN